MEGRKEWTEDEEVYLEYYLFGDAAEDFERETNYDSASEFLGIPNKKITRKATKMRQKGEDLGYVRKPFSEKEIDFLRKSYDVYPVKYFAEAFGRLESTIVNKANELGLTKRKKIGEYDDEIRVLASKGYHRAKIARVLGLKKSSVVAYINRNKITCEYARKEISQEFWRNDETIRHRHIANKTYLK